MSTLLKPLQVRTELLRRGTSVFTGQDFARIFRVTKFRAKYFLEKYTKAGLFIRLKRGLYALHDQLPSEEEIANLLYRPSYLSFEYALLLSRLMQVEFG
jgi:predicted transcriptional regulator of viral defense system